VEIVKKLNEIQTKLNAPKNQKNNFGNYSYRSCEDILQAVKPLLGGGVIVISDEIVQIGDRIYIKATATFKHDSEELSNTAYAREPLSKKGMDESEITGAASSYARKYALNGLLLIDDNKDADTQKPVDEKDEYETLVEGLMPSLSSVREALANDDYSTARESWYELTSEEQSKIWKAPSKGGFLTTEERAKMKSTEWSKAK